MAKIIFFQAHPDDLEHKCGHIMHFLSTKSKKKHEIRIASITKGDFIFFLNFKAPPPEIQNNASEPVNEAIFKTFIFVL